MRALWVKWEIMGLAASAASANVRECWNIILAPANLTLQQGLRGQRPQGDMGKGTSNGVLTCTQIQFHRNDR
jgi:hypothetical protein